MTSGAPYIAADPYLYEQAVRGRILQDALNRAASADFEHHVAIARQLFASFGEGSQIVPPFRADYGCNIAIGERCYINFDCCFLDCASIAIGDRVLIGPRTILATAGHPLDPATRATGLEFAHPIVIESDVWIGAGVVINPGVRVGHGSVVASGAVVTRDVPPMSVVAGVPAVVKRKITDDDAAEGKRLQAQLWARLEAERRS